VLLHLFVLGLLAGCAGAPETATPDTAYGGGEIVNPDSPLQCVPYARDHSQVALYGDAYTWWDQAAGRFSRGAYSYQLSFTNEPWINQKYLSKSFLK